MFFLTLLEEVVKTQIVTKSESTLFYWAWLGRMFARAWGSWGKKEENPE